LMWCNVTENLTSPVTPLWEP